MGGALKARGLVRVRVAGCQFVGNGGDECLAGGAVAVGTCHRDPIPGQLSFLGCEFVDNAVCDAANILKSPLV